MEEVGSGGCCSGAAAVRGGLDEDGAGGGCGVPCPSGGDVIDRVGNGLAGVDCKLRDGLAVEVGRDAEVEVGLGAGNGGAEARSGGRRLGWGSRRSRACHDPQRSLSFAGTSAQYPLSYHKFPKGKFRKPKIMDF